MQIYYFKNSYNPGFVKILNFVLSMVKFLEMNFFTTFLNQP